MNSQCISTYRFLRSGPSPTSIVKMKRGSVKLFPIARKFLVTDKPWPHIEKIYMTSGCHQNEKLTKPDQNSWDQTPSRPTRDLSLASQKEHGPPSAANTPALLGQTRSRGPGGEGLRGTNSVLPSIQSIIMFQTKQFCTRFWMENQSSSRTFTRSFAVAIALKSS